MSLGASDFRQPADSKRHILDYGVERKHSRIWSVAVLSLGLAGALITIALARFCETSHRCSPSLPIMLCSISSLAFIYLCQDRFRLRGPKTPFGIIAELGVSLVFLWAPLFLVLSIVGLLT